jgi:hypothetical protein
MALTGSGQISFNDVRIEMSQSAKTPYEMGSWTWGYNYYWADGTYAPINVLSTGSCRSYSMYYGFVCPSGPFDYYYINCSGTTITGSIGSGETDYFNAISGSITGILPGCYTLTDLGSVPRFSESNPLNLSNLSMSAWYSYDHTLSIDTSVTGTLYQHADVSDQCFPSTMLIMDVGTTDTIYAINISGSFVAGEEIYVYYGKPWNNTGASGTGSATFITKSYSSDMSFNYDYVYNASSGSNLYFVMTGGCP